MSKLKPEVPKKRKVTVKHKSTEKVEEYANGEPCKHEDCSNEFRRLPCRYCGRVRMRGMVTIQDRIGPVYLERMTQVSIRQHNELTPEQQEKHLIEIWRAPKYSE